MCWMFLENKETIPKKSEDSRLSSIVQSKTISNSWIIPNTDYEKRSTPIISIFKFLTELIDLLPAIVIDILQDKKNYMTTLSLFMTLECLIAGLPNFWIRRVSRHTLEKSGAKLETLFTQSSRSIVKEKRD